VALALSLPGARILATDVSPEALALARRNAARHGVLARIRFGEGSLAAPLEGELEPGGLDFLISNPPYVAQWELPSLEPEVRDHDPRMALTPGGDGTALYPPLFAAAGRFLRPGGRVLVELPAGGAERISALLRAVPELEWLGTRLDLSRIPRVLLGRRR
jgi:release factor glutamine methyltransferase